MSFKLCKSVLFHVIQIVCCSNAVNFPFLPPCFSGFLHFSFVLAPPSTAVIQDYTGERGKANVWDELCDIDTKLQGTL